MRVSLRGLKSERRRERKGKEKGPRAEVQGRGLFFIYCTASRIYDGGEFSSPRARSLARVGNGLIINSVSWGGFLFFVFCFVFCSLRMTVRKWWNVFSSKKERENRDKVFV